MAKINFGGFQLGKSVQGTPQRNSDSPFRLLIMGDFAGTSAAPDSALRTIRIDRDNRDEVLSTISPTITNMLASADGVSIDVRMNELEDFHPDHLYNTLPVFGELRKLRRQLNNPDLFPKAAETILSWQSEGETEDQQSEADDDIRSEYSTEGLFDSVLEESAAQAEAGTTWEAAISDIISSSNIQKIDPRVDVLTAVVDKIAQRVMQRVLHNPTFRRLEANWLAVDRIIRGVETSGTLQIFLLDISKLQLANKLQDDSPENSPLYKLLVEETVGTAGGKPWTVIACLHAFGSSQTDVDLLARFASLAKAGSSALLVDAAASRHAWSKDTDHQYWDELRGDPVSKSLAVVWPRALFRLPYGKRLGQVESFAFEELEGNTIEPFGSSVPLAAMCIAREFQKNKWDFGTADAMTLDGLPMFYRAEDDELQTPGEFLLSDREGNELRAGFGITPLFSVRDTESILFSGIGSVGGGALL